jgi:FixJ family two-component response regulator
MVFNHSIVSVVSRNRATEQQTLDTLADAGWKALVFLSVPEFLNHYQPDRPGCLIVSLESFGTSELELQDKLLRAEAPPTIFMTTNGDLPHCVQAVRKGAIDILQKPVASKHLLDAVEAAVAADREIRITKSEIANLQKHYNRLTPRERQVLPLVTEGLLNKQTAAELGTSEITICVHRGQIMRKMAARSLPELVRMADKLGVQRLGPVEYASGRPLAVGL